MKAEKMLVEPRSEIDTVAWDGFASHHPSGWLWHTGLWIDYCLAYAPGSIDLSFAVRSDNGLILGLCPLILADRKLEMGANPCAWPLPLIDGVGEFIMSEVMAMASVRDIRVTRFMSSPLAQDPIVGRHWDGWEDASFESQVIDLRQSSPEIWSGVKDGHRADIHRGLRELVFDLGNTKDALDYLHWLHVKANGRETRSSGTWDINHNLMKFGMADICLASRDGKIVGGAMFFKYKDGVYFASAAWPEKHVAHAVMWTAIRHYRSRGFYQLEIGWLNTGSLAIFKRGFGGEARKVICKQWKNNAIGG